MEIRFTKQKDDYSCGPIAIINLCKWAGYKFSAKKWLKKFQKLANCDTEGTYFEDLHKALKQLNGKYFQVKKQYKYKVSLKDLKNHCNSDGAVLLRFGWPKKSSCHYIVVTKFTKQKVEVINYYVIGPACNFMNKADFKKILKTRKSAVAWLISKPKSEKQKTGTRLSSSDFKKRKS